MELITECVCWGLHLFGLVRGRELAGLAAPTLLYKRWALHPQQGQALSSWKHQHGSEKRCLFGIPGWVLLWKPVPRWFPWKPASASASWSAQGSCCSQGLQGEGSRGVFGAQGPTLETRARDPSNRLWRQRGTVPEVGVPSPCETHPGPPPRRGFGPLRASEFFFHLGRSDQALCPLGKPRQCKDLN